MTRNRITRRSLKRKIIGAASALFITVALIASGFSAWIISTNAKAEADIGVSVATVSKSIMTISVDGLDQNGKLDMKTLISVGLNERDKEEDRAEFFVLLRRPNGSVVSALADSDYINNVFSTLYTTLEGDGVVDIITDETDLSKYGLETGKTR